MDDKYVASFEYCQQVGPENWENVLNVKICTNETTVGEIQKWRKGITKFENDKLYIQITQATE